MKLNHPTIPNVSVDVRAKDSRPWLRAGWLKEIKPEAPEPVSEATDSQ